MHKLTLTVGDWSADGHNITEQLLVKSSLDATELAAAFEEGSNLIGFNLTKQVACNYDDRNLSDEFMAILTTHGFTFDDDAKKVFDYTEWEPYKNPEGGYFLTPESFTELFLFIAMLARPDARFVEEKVPSLNVGGYGLFVQ